MRNPYEDERGYDDTARADYLREAYGDPCACGTLRWGADCPVCYREDDGIQTVPAEPLPASEIFLSDSDIPF